MSPEPAELQILKQILGDERGTYVFGANVMASELARLSQQVQEQANQIEQMQPQQAEASEPMLPRANVWTEAVEPEPATAAAQEGP